MSRADKKIILKKSKEHKWIFIFLIEFHFLSESSFLPKKVAEIY